MHLLYENKSEIKTVTKIVNLIFKIIDELKLFINNILICNISKEDLNYYFLKFDLQNKNLLFNIKLYNSITKTVVIKSYVLTDLIRDCETKKIELKLNYDIKTMILKSKENVHKDITEVYI
ncbi:MULTISPECIES: hypothetical protein [unclassified Clostridioides]|uniref:hypothetical protein n=1 Tax=unclassified Clostridioides TaxID=2635829 RepID=UPI0006BBE8AC|nr:hypothetical protein KW95_12435 [Clostridioides difficile]MCC0692747.1 hypothetical protein [Clostridioides sp. ZZV14-6387]KPI50790.1 hypothetical protein KW94_12820 [Clostridioides difficile]MCI9974698.1 hypothetical protein [Clostridioides difficile]CZR97731.1 hypothetical protein CDFC105_62524 [Clostridioides difficile]